MKLYAREVNLFQLSSLSVARKHTGICLEIA